MRFSLSRALAKQAEQQPGLFPSENLTMDNRVPKVLTARAALAAAGLLAFASGRIAAEPQAFNVPPAGFVALFNGHDLTGWKGLVLNPKLRPTLSSEELAERQKTADEKMHKHWKIV